MHIKIPEAQAKRALYTTLDIPQNVIAVTDVTQLAALTETEPWLTQTPLVAKPDIFIGKRGKNNLISLNQPWHEIRQWLTDHWGQTVVLQDTPVVLDQFLIEPYIPHPPEQEYFLSIQTAHDHDVLLFSENGGVDVEDNWDTIHSLNIDLLDGLPPTTCTEFVRSVIPATYPVEAISDVIVRLYDFFVTWGFVSLEINPLIITNDAMYIADLKCRIDSDAQWQAGESWKEFFDMEPRTTDDLIQTIEKTIKQLDANSGSSLKLRVLNPNGSVWPLVAGGGASIIVADALTQKGMCDEIGFYGEYSGNPDHQLMHEYTEGVVRLLLQAQTTKPKYLLILGAVANFTDVAETFAGIGSVLHKYANQLRQQHVTVIVRRGGPNYVAGLAQITQQLQELQLPHTVHGPETDLTQPIWSI